MPEVSAVIDRAARINRVVFAAIAVVSFVSLFVLARGSSGNASHWFGFADRRLLVVTSGSMQPAIRVGDAVFVKPLASGAGDLLEVGDVVTFRAANNPQFLITHRIVSVGSSAGGRRFYETKGDANSSVDTSVLNPERIVGVVTRIVPRLGSVLVAMQAPRTIATFLAGFFLFELAFLALRASRLVLAETPSTDPA